MSDDSSPASDESSVEEVDDQFRALMEGLRTTIPGVMVLFSFLLVLPTQSAFVDFSTLNTLVFYTAYTSSALSAILLIAPSVHQRVRAPVSGIKRRTMAHVMVATNLAIAGTGFFLVAIASVVFLVSSLVLGDVAAASLATGIAALAAGWAWFYLPLVQFRKNAN